MKRTRRFAAAALVGGLLISATLCAGRGWARPGSGSGSEDGWLDHLIHGRKTIERTRLIPWSHASSRPDFDRAPDWGAFVWHDRNTVHLSVRGDRRRQTGFRGWVEIRDGKLDSLKDDHTEGADEFRQVTENRLLFRLDAGSESHGFRFNLRDGRILLIHIEADGRKTDRIFYGESLTESHGDPVTFDLGK